MYTYLQEKTGIALRTSAPTLQKARHTRIGPTCEITDNDVIIFKGASSESHTGNTQYKDILKDAMKTSAMAKGQLSPVEYAESCVKLIHNLQPRGRFLMYIREENDACAWYELGKYEHLLPFNKVSDVLNFFLIPCFLYFPFPC